MKKISTYNIFSHFTCSLWCELASFSLTCHVHFSWRDGEDGVRSRLIESPSSNSLCLISSSIIFFSSYSYPPRDNLCGYIFLDLLSFPFFALSQEFRSGARLYKFLPNILINNYYIKNVGLSSSLGWVI